MNGVYKWYNFETSFRTLKELLRGFLKALRIKYELSDCSGAGFGCWHFEIYTDAAGARLINNWLDDHSIINE